MNLYWVATAGAFGCNVGSIPAYELGKRGGRAAIVRWGKYVLLDTYDLELAERFFARFGSAAVLIARMLPIVRSFIAFPAGIARMPLPQFHIYTFVGSWPFCFGLAWVGMVLGGAWNNDPRVKAWFHRFDAIIVLAGVAFVAWFLWTRWKRRAR
jgi:membrane protein DedA with SNARE-associated domain